MEPGFICAAAFYFACKEVAQNGGWAMAVPDDVPVFHHYNAAAFDVCFLFPRYDSF